MTCQFFTLYIMSASAREIFLNKGLDLVFVLIDAGSFVMFLFVSSLWLLGEKHKIKR